MADQAFSPMGFIQEDAARGFAQPADERMVNDAIEVSDVTADTDEAQSGGEPNVVRAKLLPPPPPRPFIPPPPPSVSCWSR